jgi:flagellar basal-body rod modification protein FlgD
MADTSSITSSSSIATNYMKILVAQLQNQNPLDPMDNNQMASQLAQLSQLEQIETMNTKFSDVVSASQRSYASSLIGKQVSFTMTDSSGNTITDDTGNFQLFNGTVSGMITQGNDTKLQVGNYTVGLDNVMTVM